MSDWSWPAVLIILSCAVAGWLVGLSYLLAYASGWQRLARAYRTSHSFSGKLIRSWGVSMRWGVNYSNLIALGANSLGIYLSVSWLLRAGHPPLFIPLEEISVIPVDSFDVLRASQPLSVRLGVIFGKREKRSRFNYVKLQFDKCPTIHLLIPINVAEKLSQTSAFRFSPLIPPASTMHLGGE